jgi:hypothetical protein
MKERQRAWVIAIAAILAVGLFVIYIYSSSQQVYWFEFYRSDEKQPYDLSVASTLLQDYFPGKQFTVLKRPLKEVLPIDSSGNSCYVFIGHSLYLASDDQYRLTEFVRKGNEAIIATNEFPGEIMSSLFDYGSYYNDDLYSVSDSEAVMNFTHPQFHESRAYQFDFIFQWKKENYEWYHFADSLLYYAMNPIIRLGDINNQYANFIKLPYGKGAFYLHSNPMVFTNYQLKDENHLAYAGKVFSHLQPANIYWDEFSKVPQYTSHQNPDDTETPLRYILSQPSLKYAWYVLLLIAACFLLFRTKRTQKVIPVLEPNTNTSLEYIHTIARLYFLQNDHHALALQKMKLFLAFIRTRYNLSTKSPDPEFVRKLSIKSQISERKIRSIFEEYKTITNMENITGDQLAEFHNQLDGFYKQCK